MRKRSVYLIAAGFLLLICLGIFETFSLVPDTDMFRQCVRTAGEDRYVVSGTEKEQRIYQITESGKLVRMSEKIKGETLVSLAASEDGAQLLWLFGYEENGNQYYRLRIYSKELELADQLERQKIAGEIPGRMCADGEKLVVATLSDDRKTAGIYELDLSKESASFKETESVNAPEKRFFIRAAKMGDVFYAQYDNGLTVSVKASGQTEETVFPDSLKEEEFDTSIEVSGALSVLRYEGVKVFTDTLLKWAALIFLLFLLYGLSGRTSYRFRRFAVQELVLLCSLSALCGIGIHFLNVQDKEMSRKHAENCMQSMCDQMEAYVQAVQLSEDYADTEAYENAYSAMLDIRKSGNWEKTPVSVRLVRNEVDAYKVVMADTETAGSLFTGKETEREALYEAEGKNKAVCFLEQPKEEYVLSCAVPAGAEIVQNSYWSLNMSAEKSESTVKTIRWMLILSWVSAAAGTIILLALLYIEGKQMRQLVDAFRASAQGEYKKEKRPRLNTELETLWNGLDDYAKGMERIQYRQNSQQKLYARFIPKALEVLSPGWTPERLHAGEFVSDCGIVGCISADGDEAWTKEQQTVMNRMMDLLFQVQEKEKAAFVPQSADLKIIWGIFLNGEENAVHTSIRLLGDIENMSILVHRSPYTYGITGNESQVTPYFSVEAGSELMYYTEKLRKHHIKAAITEEMAGGFENKISMRYIGYIVISGVNRSLYEVLEAYPVSKRYAMETQIPQFIKALEMYYDSDFYLARNIFAEILREYPQDEVAKWYLFACEKRLGSANAAEDAYGLFMGD